MKAIEYLLVEPGPAEDFEWETRGRWWPTTRADGTLGAVLNCPGCGRWHSLQGQSIDVEGYLAVEVTCPHGCGFRAPVKLEGWHQALVAHAARVRRGAAEWACTLEGCDGEVASDAEAA